MSIHDPHLDLDWLLHAFDPISLEELNAKAEMMARIDNKYVVRRTALQRALPELVGSFDILDIRRRRAFGYDTRYFDDASRSAYHEQHQGLRKDFKARTRSYADTGLCYLEVKVKGQRGMTLKNRIPHDPGLSGILTDEAMEFARQTYEDHYRKPFHYDLQWALDVHYKRITLVAKDGGNA